MEEYSESRDHKSEPEPRNGNVNTVYFNNQARGRISRTEFVYDEREHAMANFYLYLNFLLRINYVRKNILYKLASTLKHYKVM